MKRLAFGCQAHSHQAILLDSLSVNRHAYTWVYVYVCKCIMLALVADTNMKFVCYFLHPVSVFFDFRSAGGVIKSRLEGGGWLFLARQWRQSYCLRRHNEFSPTREAMYLHTYIIHTRMHGIHICICTRIFVSDLCPVAGFCIHLLYFWQVAW